MPPGLLPWIVIPLIGALIGYCTNLLAVKMIFRPIKPVNVLGYRLQGLMGRRQDDLARSIGRVVGSHLLQHEDIAAALGKMDIAGLVDNGLERGLAPKLEELRKLPMVGMFLTDERVAEFRGLFVQGLTSDKDGLANALEKAVEEGLDVQAVVERKVAAFPVEKLESLVLEVARKELRSIEVLGGVLGFLIGLVQVGVLQLL